MGGSKWMKAKLALGLKLNPCLYVSKTTDDLAMAPPLASAVALSPRPPRVPDVQVQMPGTPTPSSSGGLQLPKHSSKSCKKICAICLGTMQPGCGHAIFTAECSHAFHFHCIASNVKHGKQTCPVCRAKWKEIPFKSTDNKLNGKSRISVHQEDDLIRAVRRLPSPRANVTAEPDVFDDDDELSVDQPNTSQNDSSPEKIENDNFTGMLEVKTFPEVSAVAKSKSFDKFSILVHLKAPVTTGKQDLRAAVDLVTVLDVSGSMAGTKLALLKRAMGFVIQNLGPSDRLSVIAFSSNARRLFPLRRMNDTGKHEALQAVNSLSSNGGTNISEGLRKAAKVMTDRKDKNPVCSIILLSDGQDTYTINSTKNQRDYRSLLPVSMHRDSTSSLHIPVHAFGFGSDHDSVSMHLISETSGGTFSFIEAESTIQDAFAQCIGGLLSVVVQDLKVEIDCIDPIQRLVSIKSGSYKTVMASDKKQAIIKVGDLYAEEERDFLVTIDIPINRSTNEMSLIKVGCIYNHPVSKSLVTFDSDDVKIQRPIETGPLTVSLEVEKQRNRLRSAEGMAEARAAAEEGDLASAVSILEKCRKNLSETMLARDGGGDRLCVALDAELREMQERMANRHVYEASGRAYVLSGLSSHSWQRATARGDSTDSTSLVHAYQTPSMVDMVNLSQTVIFGRPSLRATRSFPARPQPR